MKWAQWTIIFLMVFAFCFGLSIGCGDDDDDDDDGGDDEDDDDIVDDDDGDDDADDDDDTTDDDDDTDDDDTADDDDDDDDTTTDYWLYFDGVNDYVDLGVGNWLDDVSYTIEAWVEPLTPVATTGSVMIIGSANSGPMANWFMAIGVQSQHIHGGHWAGAEQWLAGTTPAYNPASPLHTAISYDQGSGMAKLFLNGVKQDEIVYASGPGQIGDIAISFGAKINHDLGDTVTSYFKGYLDEVRISDVARYSEDFTPETRFTSDASTVGLWHFDEGSGDTLFDSSPNNHHGIIYNAVYAPR